MGNMVDSVATKEFDQHFAVRYKIVTVKKICGGKKAR